MEEYKVKCEGLAAGFVDQCRTSFMLSHSITMLSALTKALVKFNIRSQFKAC